MPIKKTASTARKEASRQDGLNQHKMAGWTLAKGGLGDVVQAIIDVVQERVGQVLEHRFSEKTGFPSGLNAAEFESFFVEERPGGLAWALHGQQEGGWKSLGAFRLVGPLAARKAGEEAELVIRRMIDGLNTGVGQIRAEMASMGDRHPLAVSDKAPGLRSAAAGEGKAALSREAARKIFESCEGSHPHQRMTHMLNHGMTHVEAVLTGVRESLSFEHRHHYLALLFVDQTPEEAKASFEAATAAGVPVQDILMATPPVRLHLFESLMNGTDLYNAGREIQSRGLYQAYVGEVLELWGMGGGSLDNVFKEAQAWDRRVRKAAGFNG